MENKTAFDPQRALGDKLAELGRRELCELVSALCTLVLEQAGVSGYRGGIFPENISLDESGAVALGPAAQKDWTGQELSFLAPEVFWNGEGGPASDVYSLGLLLYYAIDSARLPFAKSGEETAHRRRMNGERFDPPKAAGRRLGEIVDKATRFQASERYRSVSELKAMLDSCVSNRYLGGAPSAETVFHKSDEELSGVERMMVSILARDAEEHRAGAPKAAPEEKDPTVDEALPAAEQKEEDAAMPEAPEKEQIPVPEEPAAEKAEDEAVETPQPPEEKPPVYELREEKNPELEPVVPSRPAPAPRPTRMSEPQSAPAPEEPEEQEELTAPVSVRFDKNVERERKIASQVRRRRARPIIFVVVVCALLLLVASINRRINERDERGYEPLPLPTVPASELTPQPAASALPDPLPLDSPNAQPEASAAPVEHAYQLFVEDVSWSEARARCLQMGGHLVVISDEEEFRKITALAEQYNSPYIWVGCARVNGVLSWENDEAVVFYPWGTGEPSYRDGYDGVSEDYVLLWKLNGAWVYNDSRNDPVGDYPQAYRGKIAYICEYDDGIIP